VTRDYRHGHGQKQSFQRRSQQEAPSKEASSVGAIWWATIIVSTVLIAVFFIVKHFLMQESAPLKITDQVVLQEEGEEESIASPEAVVESLSLQATEDVLQEDESESVDTKVLKHYSFYHGLSQTEVVVEAELISVALTQPYYIQAGSFGSEKVAKQEQRRLAKHGHVLTVSALTKGSRTYYRLRAGPFTDRLVMNKQRNELRKFGVDTLLIKATK